MKSTFYCIALLVSAALAAQGQAGGRPVGAPMAPSAVATHSTTTALHASSVRSFGSRPMINPGSRFGAPPLRPAPAPVRQHSGISSVSAPVLAREYNPGTFNRAERSSRSSAKVSRSSVETRGQPTTTAQVRHGTNLPPNWRNHAIARRSVNWHRDWDRRRDHWWHGHHCRFIDGSWVIFDFGFYPWWPYWYPSYYYGPSYYGYDYYPYNYTPGYYDQYQGGEYYDEDNYGSSSSYPDATVAAAQERLKRAGYYHAEIDGLFGPQTRRALARYQRGRGLSASGYLTTETLTALGISRVTSN